MAQIPLQTKDRASVTKELSAQTCINMQPVTRQEGTRTKKGYIGTPGLALFGSATAGSQVRGIKAAYDDSTCYAVVDTDLVTLAANGARTSIGTVAGTGRVTIELGVDQVFFNRTDSNVAYTYTPSTANFSQVTDADFLGAQATTTQDTYLIYVPSNQTAVNAGRFYLSSAADFRTFSSLQFATEEGLADPLQACASINRDLWLVGTKTTGIWYDSGATVPFDRRTWIQKGTSAKYSVASFDGMIAFLGDSENGRLGVFAGGVQSAYTLTEITNFDVAYTLNGYTTISDAYGFFYNEAGSTIYQISLPTANKTWCYDFGEEEWFQKTDANGNYHAAFCCTSYRGNILVGDRSSGAIYTMSYANLDDNGQAIPREIQHPQLYNDNKWQRVSRVQYDVSAGVGNVNTAAPVLTFYVSKDSGHTYDSGTNMSLGASTEYTTRAFKTRLGGARVFQFKVTTSARARIYLSSLSVEISGGGL